MTVSRSLVVLAALGAAAGCASEHAPPIGRYELAPAPSDRVILNAGHGLQLGAGGAAVLASGTDAGSPQLQIDLPSALAVAGARSVDVRYAQAKTDEARQAIYAAWASLLPTIAPGIEMRAHRDNLQRSAGDFIEVTKQSQMGGVAAAAEWSPGDVIFKALAASRRTDAAQAATETARAENALQVAEAYYDLVRARALVRIADQALEEARGLEHDEEARERRGAGIRADVLRAQADVSEQELLRTQAEAQVAVASARLAALLQLKPDVELVPTDDMPIPIVLVSNDVPMQQLLDKAETARPELHESQATIEARQHEHEGVKWGPLVPTAIAGAKTGMLGAELGNSIESNDFGVGVGWRIGPGGLFDIPAINAAAARVRQARITDEGLRVEIARQVVEARANAVAADREVVSARNGVVAAQEALRLSKERLEKGAGIVLEVLDAERALTNAQSAEVQATVDLNRAQYRLLRSIGEPIDTARPR